MGVTTKQLGRRPGNLAHRREARKPVFWVNLALKAALISLLLFALASPDLPQFQGKAIGARAALYPLAALVIPFAWWVAGRRRNIPYPYDIDILFILPFLIDTAGNAANLYDTIDVWDDVNHLVNWGILSAAFGRLLVRFPLNRVLVASLTIGFGAVTAIIWEFAEYVSFVKDSPEAQTAYTDTLGDLALGLTGTLIAAILLVTVFWPHERSARGGPRDASSDSDTMSGRSPSQKQERLETRPTGAANS